MNQMIPKVECNDTCAARMTKEVPMSLAVARLLAANLTLLRRSEEAGGGRIE